MRTITKRQLLLLAVAFLSAAAVIMMQRGAAPDDRCVARAHRDGAARHLDYGSSVACDWGFGARRGADGERRLADDRGRAKISLTAAKALSPAAE